MDRKHIANALMDYTTADILNTPINRGAVLPFTEYADRSEFDLSSGIPGSIGRAVTAPARAYRGEMTDDQMIDEAANLAGWMTLGGGAAAASAPAKDSLMSMYKAMGPKDAPGDALQRYYRQGAHQYGFDDWSRVYDNKQQRWGGRVSDDILLDLFSANSNKHPLNMR